MAKSKLLTISAYAAHRRVKGLSGQTQNAIREAIKAERLLESISRTGRGHYRIDPEVADREWHENTQAENADQRMAAVSVPADRKNPAPGLLFGAPETGQDPRANGRGKRASLIDATTLLRGYEAQHKRLKFEQAAGNLVDKQVAAAEFSRLFKITRDRLLGIPDRVDAELAAETDADKVNARLEREIVDALEELTR